MKFKVAITLAILALFLSGCGAIDKVIDDTISLQSMAFINFSQGAAAGLLLPLKCLVPIALLGAISGIKKQNWAKVRKMLGLMFGIGLLPYVLPALEQMGRITWPQELTLSWIAGQVGWTFPIPIGDANPLSFIWTLSCIVNWPLFHAVMQIVTAMVLIIAVSVAIMTWSWRPLMVGLASVMGWVLAPGVVKNVTELLSSVRPDNAITSTLVAFNLIYLCAMFGVGLVMYFLFPILVMVFMPGESAEEENPTQDELPPANDGTQSQAPEEESAEPFVWPYPDQPSGGTGDGNGGNPPSQPDTVIYGEPPDYPKLPGDGQVIDGEFRDVRSGEDDQKALPEPAAYGDENRDEEDELPSVQDVNDAESSVASVSTASIIIDDLDEHAELPTVAINEVESVSAVVLSADPKSDDQVSADDELPGESPSEAFEAEEPLQSGPDLFESEGPIVIGDEP